MMENGDSAFLDVHQFRCRDEGVATTHPGKKTAIHLPIIGFVSSRCNGSPQKFCLQLFTISYLWIKDELHKASHRFLLRFRLVSTVLGSTMAIRELCIVGSVQRYSVNYEHGFQLRCSRFVLESDPLRHSLKDKLLTGIWNIQWR